MGYLIILIRSLQIVLYLALLHVNLPSIASNIFEIIIPVAFFDIVNLLAESQLYINLEDKVFGEVDEAQTIKFQE